MSGSEAGGCHRHQAGLLSTQGSAAASIPNAHRGRIEIADWTVDERWLAVVVEVRQLQSARDANQEAGVGAIVARHRLPCSFRLRQMPCRLRRLSGTRRWDGDGVRRRRRLRHLARGSQAQDQTSSHPPPPPPISYPHRPVVDSSKSSLPIRRTTKPNHAAVPARAPHRHPRGSVADP